MIDVEALKAQLNIVDVIERYIPLKKAGANYQTCCPFHNEKSPSFTVNENKQFFHCFGCGENGSVIDFIMKYMGLEFLPAAQLLGGKEEININPCAPIKKKTTRISLPLDKKPHCKNEMQKFIDDRCEIINGRAFYGSNLMIYTTDINENTVSMVMVQGKGFAVRHYKKELLYGSCIIMGEINSTELTLLSECYYSALKAHNESGITAVCFFEPLNLRFIYNELKRKTTNVMVLADSQETITQCDKLHLLNCSYKTIQNKIEI